MYDCLGQRCIVIVVAFCGGNLSVVDVLVAVTSFVPSRWVRARTLEGAV